jgi:hypothetical protein
MRGPDAGIKTGLSETKFVVCRVFLA